MARYANIYDICDKPILNTNSPHEPGLNLRRLYKRSAGNLLLKTFILRGCRHPLISGDQIANYQDMITAAMRADKKDWLDHDWIDRTFAPIARLLDEIKPPKWSIRGKVRQETVNPSRSDLDRVVKATLDDVLRVWDKEGHEPYFPVAAQIILSGDDEMDGENFMDLLKGLGSYEYKNIVMLFALMRCFINSNPRKLRMIRKPFRGVGETMFQRYGWIMHRTAFYDVFFFEFLLLYLQKNQVEPRIRDKIVSIMDELIHYCVVTSREWLTSPHRGIRYPSITCLPKDDQGNALCRLSKANWRKKKELGFGDYVPDADTTFLTLAAAKRWLDFVRERNLSVDPETLRECEVFLEHPWVEVIEEHQAGSRYVDDPATIHITKPLDYYGSVSIWFRKSFHYPDGMDVEDPLGMEVCPGHNMDILESMLVNRKRWKALEGDNLKTVQRLLEFAHRALSSGNFKHESALAYYLPEIYTYYTSRFYDAYLDLNEKEKELLDPEGKVAEMRRIAVDYCRDELLGYELNPFDASLAVAALVLFRYEPKDDGAIATGLKVMTEALGEGRAGHPYKPYEWNKVKHPTRIVVGSDVSTSFFVFNACVEARRYLYGED